MTYTEAMLDFSARREKRRRDINGMRLTLLISVLLWSPLVAWLLLR